jgi:thiol:disulfide interchange protein
MAPGNFEYWHLRAPFGELTGEAFPGAIMKRIVQIVVLSAFVFGVLAAVPALMPESVAPKSTGAALAQMLPSESILIDFGSKEERMKKSRTEGPGMAALDAGAADWCVSCHRNHDRVRAARARRGQ